MNHSHNHQAWDDVALFEDLTDGRVLEAQLNNQGLEARAYDDKWFRYFLFLRPPQVTYRVQVRRNHREAAVGFLEAQKPAVLDQAIHCPDCGSLQVNFPQMTRKFMTPTVLLHLGILFRIIHHEAYCEHCHFTWELPPPKKRGLPQVKVSDR